MPQHVTQDHLGNELIVRSKLETKVVSILNDFDCIWDYEITKIPYIVPQSDHKYTVDFTLNNGVFIEAKGYLSDHQERYKYILIKQQHPTLDLRFIFDNPNKLVGGTKQTHGAWATKYGFKWCGIKDVEQIHSWVKEAND